MLFLCALAALAAYATVMFRGPRGVAALQEKQHEADRLEEQNANLRRAIDDQKTRIDKLEHDPGTQESVVRQRTGKTRPGDTSFVVPGQPAIKPDATQ